MSRIGESIEQRRCVTEDSVGHWIGQENVRGRKMGYRTSAQATSYVPAHHMFLPAGYPAIDDRGGTMSRLMQRRCITAGNVGR